MELDAASGGSARHPDNSLGTTLDIVEDDLDEREYKPPKGRSIAHHFISSGKAVYISLDMETGGEYCGIIQLSAEMARMEIREGRGVGNDKADATTRIPTKFNEYINPGECAIWDDNVTKIHGLCKTHEKIVLASSISIVWQQFRSWIFRNMSVDEKAILVAYNGETCDLKWLLD